MKKEKVIITFFGFIDSRREKDSLTIEIKSKKLNDELKSKNYPMHSVLIERFMKINYPLLWHKLLSSKAAHFTIL